MHQITAPMLLHVCICLCVLWLHSPAQALVTPEHEASARKLLQDNLHVSLAHWHKLRAEQGRKLTMQTFFRTAYRHLKNPHIAFWGIKNNKVYQLDKDGELRYSTDAMLQDGKPNKGAAETMKGSLWLAIEDALSHGVSMPDMVFIYNVADAPLCGRGLDCRSGMFAPPISLMGLDPAAVPQPRNPNEPKPQFPDLLVPVFKNLGYARQTTVSPDPHHPHVLAMLGGAMKDKAIAWSSRNTIRAESVPWENKVPQLLFRGTRYCPAVPLKTRQICPRLHLTNLSIHHQDQLNIMVLGLPPAYKKEAVQHNWTSPRAEAMASWSKFKYVASIDGIGGSNRVLALFHLGSLVVMQHLSPFAEWYYNSIKPGEHFETLFKENPDGTQSFDDAPDLVNMLRSNDDYAQRIAKNGLAFARKYLIKEVMLVYLRELLLAYKDLFEDMDEYVLGVGDPGSRALFLKQAEMWKEDWRTVRV